MSGSTLLLFVFLFQHLANIYASFLLEEERVPEGGRMEPHTQPKVKGQ